MKTIDNGQSLEEAAHQWRRMQARMLMRGVLKEKIAELAKRVRPTAVRRTRLKISALAASFGMEDEVPSILDEIKADCD